jgi:hypothetical protein
MIHYQLELCVHVHTDPRARPTGGPGRGDSLSARHSGSLGRGHHQASITVADPSPDHRDLFLPDSRSR